MLKPINLIAIALFVAAWAPSSIAQDARSDDDAAKLFQKMEERLAKARSVTCSLKLKYEGTGEPGAPLRKGQLAGSLALAEGKRVRFELHKGGDEVDEPGVPHWLTISDGQRMLHQDSGMPKPQIGKAGKEDVLEDFTTLLARSGLYLVTLPLPPVEARDMKDRFPVSEFKLGPQEKVGNLITQRLDYRCDVKGQKQPDGSDAPFRASVWLDPKTSLPLKRTITWKLAGVQVIAITEHYENLIVDEKLDPSIFQVPEE
jgi:outer membrane lipoprotein-sorting protein